MATRVQKVSYCALMVSNRAGQGTLVLAALSSAGVNLIAYSGFPEKGKAQLDLVPEKMSELKKVARREGWKLGKVKKAFVVQGDDRVGVAQRLTQKLADRKINITSAQAIAAGKGRFGMILWVRPKDYGRAVRVLRAR